MKRITIIVVLAYFIGAFECRGLKEEFTWTRINYWWPTNTKSRSGYFHNDFSTDAIVFPENEAAESEGVGNQNTHDGTYIYENNIPMGANRWKDKLFITVPRRRVGVPSTLNFVWMNSTQRHNVPLIPYPSWRINQFEPRREHDGLVSVYRTAVDVCDRLWVLDNGLIETPGNNSRILPGRLIIIDLNTDQIIRQYTFKSTDVTPATTLANLAIDITGNQCDRAFAYMPDLSGYGLIVYDFHENDSWRLTHNYFYLESIHGEFNIGGFNFQWNDGVFSVALSDVKADGYRDVYFHSMAGARIFRVSTKILRNNPLATRSYHENDFKVVVDRGEGFQTSASDLHQPSGVLFLCLVNQNAVGCWNTNKNSRKENFDIVHKDDKKMIYPCDLKIYKDEVVMLSNTMPVFLYGKLNYDEINFRVWISKVSDAVQGTTCAVGRKPGYH